MKKIRFLIFSILFTIHGYGQTDTLINKQDSLIQQADSITTQTNNTTAETYTPQVNINFKIYFKLLGKNLKQGFTKPFHTTKKEWIKFGAFSAATALLFLADEPVQQEALRFRNKNPGIVKVGSFITNFGGLYEMYTLGGLGAYSFIFKNQKLKNTTLLATQAYFTGGAIETVIKLISGRTRPNYYHPDTEAEPMFKGPFGNVSTDYSGHRSNSSFPSGHATVAFAAATVFAMEYRSTIWVPVVSYTAATLISATRITENKHWITDVFVGGVLGYFTGRQVVNTYHRYARSKSAVKSKGSLSFNMQYNAGHMEPGLVYTCR